MIPTKRLSTMAATVAFTMALLAACGNRGIADAAPAVSPKGAFTTTEVAKFDSPWAMTFLPDNRLLVTEMAGTLRLYDPARKTTGTVSGVPKVAHAGQGGFGDVVLHPQFQTNKLVYISYLKPLGIFRGFAASDTGRSSATPLAINTHTT